MEITRTTAGFLGGLLAVVGLGPLGVQAAAAAPTSVAVAADAYVSAAKPTANYGTATSLWVDGSPVMRTFLRFPAQAVLPARAMLKVYATRSTQGFEVRAVPDSTWKETGLTYSNAPAVGAVAVSTGSVAKGSWVAIDVTALLPASGEISLAVTPLSSTAQAIASRESGSTRAPRLEVEAPAPAGDTEAPSVGITGPSDGAVLQSAGIVGITTGVADNVGVTKVEFLDNGTLLGTEDTAPFTYSWSIDAGANGAHSLTAKAFDAAGNATTSAAVAVTVNIPTAPPPTPSPTPLVVPALRETAPVPHSGDAADDIAIWANPDNPGAGAIIGTDKLGGLAVYDPSGAQLHYYADSAPNNVDLREGFPLGGRSVVLVVTSDRTTDALRTYVLDPATRSLASVDARTLAVGIGLYGLCMYRSPSTGSFYVFDSDSSGTTQQWELFDNGSGKVDARKVRTIAVGSTSEGCVADDETGTLFLAEEDVALWAYSAEPSGGSTRSAVDTVGAGRLSADIEGLALYRATSGRGYLLASSQGSSTYAVYNRAAPYAPLGTFSVGAGTGVDAVTYTDGIDVSTRSLGAGLESGVLVVQDDRNDVGNQNFKIVPWASVAGAFSPALITDAGAGSGGSGSGGSGGTGSTAPTYYVDAIAGSDANAGTSPTSAWRTLGKVNGLTLAPGMSVLLARGSAWSEALAPAGSGTASAPITVGAYGTGAAPRVGGPSTCVTVAGSYVAVRDLEVRGCSWAGIKVTGSNVVLEGNRVSDTAAGIYLTRTATSGSVLHNQLVDNNRMSVLTASPTSDDSGAFGILLHGDANEIAYNTISGSDAFSYDYGRDGAAIEVYGGIGNRIHHNVAIDNDAFSELGDPRSADNRYSYNVVRSSLDTSTFLVTRGASSSYGPVLGTVVHHNTVVLTGASSQGFVCHAGCSASVLSLRNNIIQAVAKVGYADAAFDEGYNLYSGGQRQFPLGTGSVVADPGFVAAAAGDFHLGASSAAVDLGTDLGYTADFDGLTVPVDGNGDGSSRPDAGAFERHP